MIELDQNYKDVEPVQMTSFKKPVPGGYQLICVNIEESVSKAGNPMVIIWLDIAEGEFKGTYEKFPIKFYQLCTGDHTARFNGVMKSFHDSNPGHVPFVKDNSFDASRLVKLKVGGNLRKEEYINKRGDTAVSMKVAFLCGIDKVLKGEIEPMPTKKVQNNNDSFAGNAPMGNNNYSEANPPPQDESDDLPWM